MSSSLSRRLPCSAWVIVAASVTVLHAATLVAQRSGSAAPGPNSFRQLKFRYIGPVGNRVAAVAGVPGDPLVYYAGSASGGIFKTDDAGTTWTPIFDDQPVSSIGSLAVAPSDPNIVWAGTGESWIRSNVSIGMGIYKSTDAGKTWTLMGLEKTGRIGRIVIDPRDPNIVFAAAMGHGYGPQPDRGLFRTRDGGRTWERVLFVDEDTGCADVVMDPGNPRVLFAGMWQFYIRTWGRFSGGPGSGIFISRDAGTTWKPLVGNGLPEQEVGRIGLAIAPGDANRVYAIVETGTGEPWKGKPTAHGYLYRSDDGGERWRAMTASHDVAGRPHYYSRMAVSPDNPDETYFLTASYSVSTDGGATLRVMRGYPQTSGGHVLGAPPVGDFHDMWIDPTNANRQAVANDGGVGISVNRGRTWNRVQLPNAQMYHVTTDNQIPYNVYGNRQDGPSFRGPSNSRVFGYGNFVRDISRGLWMTVGGGESGWSIADPVDPNIVWSSGTGAGALGGSIDRYDERTRQFRPVEVWPDSPQGWPARDLKYRFHWTYPVAMSPHDREKIYVGSQHLHATTDRGQSWQVISPDLTLNDKTRQGPSGGLTGDNIGPEYGGTLMAIAESPREPGVIWTGSNDGQVQVTRDGGRTWINTTSNIAGLPPGGTIYSIKPSRHAAGVAYITVDLHQENDFSPYVFKTSDYGRSWKSLGATLPRTPLSYAHAIEEDPVRQGLLFLGLENALYVSFDDGSSWLALQNNLPPAPIYGLTIQEHFNDLVIATYGRGFWILDDITPLRQMTAAVSSADAHLFAPRPAYRFRGITPPLAPSYDPTAGQNPPYGADINYFLGAAPEGDVQLTIVDGAGQAVRTLRGTREAGINRVWWDLRYPPTRDVRLHTSPIYAPWVRVPAEGRLAGGRFTMLAPPGMYTVKLSVGRRELTQSLRVVKDPHSQGTEADLRTQFTLLQEIRRNIETAGEMVNAVEVLRKQLHDVERGTAPIHTSELKAAARVLAQTLTDFEENLYQLRLSGGQDGMRWPTKLLQKLGHLAGQIQDSDFPPTAQQMDVHRQFTDRLHALRTQFDRLLAEDVAAFNALLTQRSLPVLVTSMGDVF